MKQIIVRKLGVGSVARFLGVASAIWAFVAGIFVMFGGIVSTVEQDEWSFLTKVMSTLGVVVGSLVVLPAIAFVWGWLYGAIVSLIANIFLQTSHGIEVDIEDRK